MASSRNLLPHGQQVRSPLIEAHSTNASEQSRGQARAAGYSWQIPCLDELHISADLALELQRAGGVDEMAPWQDRVWIVMETFGANDDGH